MLAFADTAGVIAYPVWAGLAERFEATLTGIAAFAPSPLVGHGGIGLPPLVTEEIGDDMQVALDQLERRFCSIAAHGGRKVEWLAAIDRPTEFVARQACSADLVIIGRERISADPFRSPDPCALLLRVGRPVLPVPAELDQMHVDRVAVAWRDTREARRAPADSLPFLHNAEKLLLVEVCAECEIEARPNA